MAKRKAAGSAAGHDARTKRMTPKDRRESRPTVGQTLIGQGGKVDPGALFRKAQAEAQAETKRVKPQADDRSLPSITIEQDEPLELEDGDEELGPLTSNQPATISSAPKSLEPQLVTFTLQRDLAKRLDKYLVDRITFLSRNKLQELIDAGRVKVNGRLGKASTKLHDGDTVEVLLDPPESEDFPPQDIPLDVLFEDEHMIVINKQADIIVHPARTHKRGTMINALAYYFRNHSKMGGDLSGLGREFARPGVVHRLDRNTSGVIVFAKSEQAHWQLASQFEHRKTDKRYIALVHGKVEPAIDVIDVPLGPHPSREKGHREKQVVRHDHLGKPAVTIYRVLGQYLMDEGTSGTTPSSGESHMLRSGPPKAGSAWNIGRATSGAAASTSATHAKAQEVTTTSASRYVSLVEVELKTGRTHQIRVHLQHRLHPLLADDMYDGKVISVCGDKPRVALHAAMLTIKHPISNQAMQFVAPFPADLKGTLKALREKAVWKHEASPPPPGSVISIAQLLG
jgi:23S rRNA pseudouridine1911/1915/1917 synthase